MSGPSGFLVSPAKSVVQPLRIQNLGSTPLKVHIEPVATVMSGKLCAPTSTPVHWFKVAESAQVAPHSTLSLPVKVEGHHATTDVAIKVSPFTTTQGVGVSFTAYAQEVVSPDAHASGCAHLNGFTGTTAHAAPGASHVHGGQFPIMPVGGGLLGCLVVAVALKRSVFRARKGAHR